MSTTRTGPLLNNPCYQQAQLVGTVTRRGLTLSSQDNKDRKLPKAPLEPIAAFSRNRHQIRLAGTYLTHYHIYDCHLLRFTP